MTFASIRQLVTIALSGLVCAVILTAPVAIAEMYLVWRTHLTYQPFVFRYSFLAGSMLGVGGRIWVIKNQRRGID